MSKNLEKVLDHIQASDDAVTQFYSGYDLADNVVQELLVSDHDKIIKYPYKKMNKVLRAIFPTSFITIGADTGCGKSQLLGNIAYSACKQGKKVVYFDFENDDGDFVMRQLCRRIGVKLGEVFTVADLRLHDLESGKHADLIIKEIGSLADEIKDMRIYKNKDLPTVDSFVKILGALSDVDLVCIDHLHYFSFEYTESQATQIERVMHKLKELSGQKRIPIVLASHLKQRRGADRTPTNYDLFGSSNIAKISKSVILMHREEIGGVVDTIFQVTKNRDGQVLCKDTARFNPISGDFEFQEQAGF